MSPSNSLENVASLGTLSCLNFFDYREFLREYYSARRKSEPFFSYRFMANRLNMDHSLLIKVMAGERHIATQAIAEMVRFLKLRSKEAEYFENLVYFCKAKNEKLSKPFFEKLLKIKGHRSFTLQDRQYVYFQNYYHSVIRSLLEYYPFEGDFKALAEQLVPPIKPMEAQKSIEVLLSLGLITKKGKRYSITDAHVTTGAIWRSLAIREYQKQAIALSVQALDSIDPSHRDISSVTMSVDGETFLEVKEMIRECREAIIKRVDQIDPLQIDRVYQLNMQFIPLTQLPKS